MEEQKGHQDPVCGMMVRAKPHALTSEYKGKTYYFCSPCCKRAFEKAPEKVLREGSKGHM